MQKIFTRIAEWFGCKAAGEHSKFIDLAPTDKADEAGVYSDALLYATSNPRVSNIALTGPYGSGKSSIIKSFLKKYRRPALQISLAAFLPEATATGGDVSKQEIERSIIQQMLYGADASKLPLSRFKRIQSPSKWSIFKSLYIILGIFACWNLLQNREKIIDGEYFLPLVASNWFNLTCFAVGGSFLWFALHHFYVASFGVSLKSISLKDIEIAPIAINQDSILNRHLDEIIYFFQSTKYELVVIEDLDRFNNSDIFVTLREINSLVNQNSGVKRTIRFLYALRDDMFMNTDRTKFFEFIIPVIPIINSSNSIDKVLEQGKRLSLDGRLKRQFLREVSRYLNDLRLIQNIFNEYAIYVANLETHGENVLDANKLLAVLIYKNVFPKDFENLHRGKGNLAQIFSHYDEFVNSGEAKYRTEISGLEEKIDNADRQIPFNIRELRRIYAMALIEKLPNLVSHIGINGQTLIEIPYLVDHDSFEQLIEGSSVVYKHNQNYLMNFNIAGFQAEVDPLRTYSQRKVEIEHRAVEFKNVASKDIRELRLKLSALRIAKFNEIVRLNASRVEDLFEAFGDNRELARFLVFEGYIDDTYYQYTSLFHSGRLSPNDNKFLIQIRGFVNPEPGFQIDNPNEVIAAMRDDDFRQSYVLNVKIVDYLLGDTPTYTLQTANFFGFVESDFEKCEAFFAAYYATGTRVSALVSRLVETWAGFVPVAITMPKNLSHIVQIIAHLPSRALETLPEKYPNISGFVSINLPQILALGVDFEPARLKHLGIEIVDLPAIESFAGIGRFLFEEGLYRLTVENVEFIFRVVLGFKDLFLLRTQHYTTVLKTSNVALISRIERNFEGYIKDILMKLERNSEESVPAILSVIACEEIGLGDLSIFLERQSALIPSLEQAPTRLHALLFQLAKVEASWDNCLVFLASENFDAESLTGYLNTKPVLEVLSQHAIPNDEKASILHRFLIENDALQDAVYRTYVQGLPRHFSKFPEKLGTGKLQILIEEGKIIFSDANLSFLRANSDLQVLFVTKNIEQYLDNENAFAVDDDFREKLLASNISDDYKLAIILSMNLTLLAGLPARAGAVGPILDRTEADMSAFDAASARAIIVHSGPISVQISLFNKCQSILADEDVREILALFPEPFSDIKTGYNIPRIKKTRENIELVKWLESRDIISSWGEAFFSDEIRINLYRR